MKIKEVNTNYILFDNGSRITFDHEQDCCETNYADFEQLEDLALEYEFENDLIFEVVPENGFRFGSKFLLFSYAVWMPLESMQQRIVRKTDFAVLIGFY